MASIVLASSIDSKLSKSLDIHLIAARYMDINTKVMEKNWNKDYLGKNFKNSPARTN
ncbi:hypothetical protein [Arenibacter certesii]|uniref:hypothetical protein n=1 Tax=Arenibacter certesii TaxID=228955 RepID=UPI00042199A4|nr:hypothetical protein [Arenibacter certesii]